MSVMQGPQEIPGKKQQKKTEQKKQFQVNTLNCPTDVSHRVKASNMSATYHTDLLLQCTVADGVVFLCTIVWNGDSEGRGATVVCFLRSTTTLIPVSLKTCHLCHTAKYGVCRNINQAVVTPTLRCSWVWIQCTFTPGRLHSRCCATTGIASYGTRVRTPAPPLQLVYV